MKVYEAGIEQWGEEDLEQGVGYTEASEAPTKQASEMNNKGTSACRIHVCQGLNSHYFHIIGDGHQPYSRGLYTHYKDSY